MCPLLLGDGVWDGGKYRREYRNTRKYRREYMDTKAQEHQILGCKG